MLKKEFDNVQNREMKSESGFRLAMASQPFGFRNDFFPRYPNSAKDEHYNILNLGAYSQAFTPP